MHVSYEIYINNPDSSSRSRRENDPVQMLITLTSGWNILSIFVTPADPSMDAIFPLPQRNDLVLCKDNDGNIYWPEFGIDGIGNWDPARGYKCYTNQSITVNLTGMSIDPSATIALLAGWNMAAYWRDEPRPVYLVLNSLDEVLVMAKSNDDEVYWPEFGINSIGDMQPGQGYKMYLNGPATLVYSAD